MWHLSFLRVDLFLATWVSAVNEGRTRFNRLRNKMPVRGRLADLLFVKAPLRSREGVCAVNDLISLIKED
jgi:hypothetical protein